MRSKYWKQWIAFTLLSIFFLWLARRVYSDYMSDAEAVEMLLFYLLWFGFGIAAIVAIIIGIKDALYRGRHFFPDGRPIEEPDFLEAVNAVLRLPDRDAYDSVRYKGVALEGLEKLYLTEDLRFRIQIFRNGEAGVTLKKEYCSRETPRRALEKGTLAGWMTCWKDVRNFTTLAEAIAKVPPEYREDDLKQHFWRKITVRKTWDRGSLWVKKVTVSIDGKAHTVELTRGMTFAVSSAAHVVKIGDSFFFLPPSYADEMWETYVKEGPIADGIKCCVHRSVVKDSPSEEGSGTEEIAAETAGDAHLPEESGNETENESGGVDRGNDGSGDRPCGNGDDDGGNGCACDGKNSGEDSDDCARGDQC